MRVTELGGSGYTIGPVSVRLSGITRADERGDEAASVAVPTVSEATVALDRAARVIGADGVEGVRTDYRRASVAAGLKVRVEIQAWGTAFSEE